MNRKGTNRVQRVIQSHLVAVEPHHIVHNRFFTNMLQTLLHKLLLLLQPSGQRAGLGRRTLGFKSQPRRCPVTVLGKLLTSILLTAKNRDQLRNLTLGNRVWANFTFYSAHCIVNESASAFAFTVLYTNLLAYHLQYPHHTVMPSAGADSKNCWPFQLPFAFAAQHTVHTNNSSLLHCQPLALCPLRPFSEKLL